MINIISDIIDYVLEVEDGFEQHLFLVAFFYIIIVILKVCL